MGSFALAAGVSEDREAGLATATALIRACVPAPPLVPSDEILEERRVRQISVHQGGMTLVRYISTLICLICLEEFTTFGAKDEEHFPAVKPPVK